MACILLVFSSNDNQALLRCDRIIVFAPSWGLRYNSVKPTENLERKNPF